MEHWQLLMELGAEQAMGGRMMEHWELLQMEARQRHQADLRAAEQWRRAHPEIARRPRAARFAFARRRAALALAGDALAWIQCRAGTLRWRLVQRYRSARPVAEAVPSGGC
jgi:hypothetical protein